MPTVFPHVVAVGIYNSRVAVKNRTVTKKRRVTMFELELPLESLGVSYINDREMPIDTGVIICAKPGQVRHTRLPFQCRYVHMIVEDRALCELLTALPDYIPVADSRQYLHLFERLETYFESGLERDTLMLQSLLLRLLYNLSHESRAGVLDGTGAGSRDPVISNALSYIQSNLSTPLPLETVAAQAGFSPIHFHNLFKAATGRTLHSYVEEQRIKKAINMLVTTTKTLTDIAYECGFSSQSYFSSAFKRRMGKTPREYAKEINSRYEASLPTDSASDFP